MEKKLIEILEDIRPGADYETCTSLVDGHYLDSLSLIALVAELEEEYDITIPAVEIVPDNFNSVENMMMMILRLMDEYVGKYVEDDC